MKVKSYIGFEVDSVRQVVRAEAKKVKKYTSLLQAMQEDPRGLGRVERLKFALLLGKMQHVAPVRGPGRTAVAA